MKIVEFVELMKNNDVTISVLDVISVKKYVGSINKMQIAKDVIDATIEYDGGFIKFYSYKQHLLFTLAVIEAHTDLRFADNWVDKVREYDILCENDLLDMIIDTFRKDYEASLIVLDMMRNDILTDNSIEASAAKLVTSVSENLDVFVGALSDKLEDLDVEKIIPNNLDLNKLQGLLNNVK